MNFWVVFRITSEGRYIWVDTTDRISEWDAANYVRDTYLEDSVVGEQYVIVSQTELERRKYEVVHSEKQLKKVS